MTKAVCDVHHDGKIYKAGTELPEKLVEFLRGNASYNLNDMIQVNSRWFEIDDKRIAGFVKENKTRLKRLIDYFADKQIKEKEEKKELEKPAKSKKTKKK
jgi:hypothetical protein